MVQLKSKMGDERIGTALDDAEYVINKKAGSSLIKKCPVFSKDGQFLYVVTKNIIRVYSIETSDLVKHLHADDSANVVVISFPVDEEDGSVLVCHEDGSLYKWDPTNGTCLSKQTLTLDRTNVVLSFDILDEKLAFVTSTSNHDKKQLQLTIFNYLNGAVLRKIECGGLTCNGNVWSIAIGYRKSKEKFAAICNGSPFVYTYNLTKSRKTRRHRNYNNVPVLAVAAHPVDSCIAIGDALGRAIIMYGDFDLSGKLEFEVLHWHQLPLSVVAFSKQGSYLLTGGMEQVVVKWTPGAQYNRVFMPRLPGQIRHITTDNVHVAIATSNNSIQIANAQLFLTATIVELGGLPEEITLPGPGLLYHAPTSALVLGSHSGHLAIFSTLTNRLLYNVDITMMNRIPPERENLNPVDMEIACAAVSSNGRWLVTSEFRDDGINASEERLKFWSADAARENALLSSPFALNTCVNLSHRGARVNEIVLSKHGDVSLTSGSDDNFRLWTTRESVVSGVRKTSWECLAVCYYATDYNLKDKIVNENYSNGDIIDDLPNGIVKSTAKLGKIALSEDGSLVAAWWGPKLGLWDSGSCDLRAFLAHPALRPIGKEVKFGNNDSAHYVVCTSEECLAVWHLLSLSLTWIVKMHPVSLTSDPFSNKMAVITKFNDVFIFKPQQSEYILCKKKALDPNLGTISSCAFAQTSRDRIKLYLLRNQQEIFCLEPKADDFNVNLEQISLSSAPMSNFGALLAEKRLNDVKARVKVDGSHGLWGLVGNKAVDELLSSSAHTLPPMSLLKTSFVEALIGAKDTKSSRDLDEESTASENDDASDQEDATNDKPVNDDVVMTEAATRESDSAVEFKLSLINKESIDWSDRLLSVG